jgi:hypothetical protein
LHVDFLPLRILDANTSGTLANETRFVREWRAFRLFPFDHSFAKLKTVSRQLPHPAATASDLPKEVVQLLNLLFG